MTTDQGEPRQSLEQQAMRLMRALSGYNKPYCELYWLATSYQAITGTRDEATLQRIAIVRAILARAREMREIAYHTGGESARATFRKIVWHGPGGINFYTQDLAKAGIHVPRPDAPLIADTYGQELTELIIYLLEIAWLSGDHRVRLGFLQALGAGAS